MEVYQLGLHHELRKFDDDDRHITTMCGERLPTSMMNADGARFDHACIKGDPCTICEACRRAVASNSRAWLGGER